MYLPLLTSLAHGSRVKILASCGACGAWTIRAPSSEMRETPKAKALWKMNAAEDRGEDFYDPEREDNILGRNKTRSALWEEHLKDPIVALNKALKCVENWY